jgi:hypothetical protein
MQVLSEHCSLLASLIHRVVGVEAYHGVLLCVRGSIEPAVMMEERKIGKHQLGKKERERDRMNLCSGTDVPGTHRRW